MNLALSSRTNVSKTIVLCYTVSIQWNAISGNKEKPINEET